MKKVIKSVLAIVIVLAGFSNLQAQDRTVKQEEFKVYGNCGMCESRIEKAAKSIDGVTAADWDKDTKMLAVSYNSGKVEMLDIHKAIAKVGHDTEKAQADDKVYEGLPGCCHYERRGATEKDDGPDGQKH